MVSLPASRWRDLPSVTSHHQMFPNKPPYLRMTSVCPLPSYMSGYLHQLGGHSSGVYRSISSIRVQFGKNTDFKPKINDTTVGVSNRFPQHFPNLYTFSYVSLPRLLETNRKSESPPLKGFGSSVLPFSERKYDISCEVRQFPVYHDIFHPIFIES